MQQEIQKRLTRINELQDIIQEAQNELEELLGLKPSDTPSKKPKRENARFPKAIPVMVQEALEAKEGTQDIDGIQKTISWLHGVRVKRGSISASLSSLKEAGKALNPSPGVWSANRPQPEQPGQPEQPAMI